MAVWNMTGSPKDLRGGERNSLRRGLQGFVPIMGRFVEPDCGFVAHWRSLAGAGYACIPCRPLSRSISN
jgi:hypothetical protein